MNATSIDKNDLLVEAILLSTCDHPNLVKFFGACFIDNNFESMVIEYMDMGDLLTFLRTFNVFRF